jgi:hypothetical protein
MGLQAVCPAVEFVLIPDSIEKLVYCLQTSSNNLIYWAKHRRHTAQQSAHAATELAPSACSSSRAYVRFEVFMAATMKNVVFWDIKPQFVLQRRHITSPLQSPDG